MAQLASIEKLYKISRATDVVITGQSAGGLATYLWANYINDLAPKTAKVWAIPDSGIFLDSPNYNNKQPAYKDLLLSFMKIANEDTNPPNTDCVYAHMT